MGNLVDRVRLIKGRLANPSAPNEVTVGEAGGQTHLRVGSHFDADSFTQTQIDDAFSGRGDPTGPTGPTCG